MERRHQKNQHYEWNVPIGREKATRDVVLYSRKHVEVDKACAHRVVEAIVGIFFHHLLNDRDNGQKGVGQQNLFEFAKHKLFKLIPFVEDVVEQKAGDKNKKNGAAADEIGKGTLWQGIEADVYGKKGVSGNNNENCDRPKVIQRV